MGNGIENTFVEEDLFLDLLFHRGSRLDRRVDRLRELSEFVIPVDLHPNRVIPISRQSENGEHPRDVFVDAAKDCHGHDERQARRRPQGTRSSRTSR